MLVNDIWEDNISCSSCKQRHPAGITCAQAHEIAQRTKVQQAPEIHHTTMDVPEYIEGIVWRGKYIDLRCL